MEAAVISVLFMLVFWGGLVFFLGEAIVVSFGKAQELLLRRMSVFSHSEYYRLPFFGKVSMIFISSDLRMKFTLCALICMFAVLCAELVSVTDSSLFVLHVLL